MRILTLLLLACLTTVAHAAPKRPLEAPLPVRRVVAQVYDSELPTGEQVLRKNGLAIRTEQQDAELKDWIERARIETQALFDNVEELSRLNGVTRDNLARADKSTDTLTVAVAGLTKWANEKSDAAKYWQEKEEKAVGKLWWWRLWAGGAIGLGVLLIFGGLLMRFTSWGARTIGPMVVKAAI